MLEIIYQDEWLVAINKPHGLLVHRTPLAKDATEFALQMLRDQLEQKVFPAHRIDRKTSGILLFTLNSDTDRQMQMLFAERKTSKRYLSIVRGHTDDQITIDYALKREDGKTQEALTEIKTLERYEIPVPLGDFMTSRYSLVEATPITGRMHQIRKHLAHIHHPIIGDRPHGCNKQNKLFKDKWNVMSMMLHAQELCFTHPITEQSITITAPLSDDFKRVLEIVNPSQLPS